MHLSKLDAYFRLASRGDKEALNILYQKFMESGKIELLSAKKNSSNFQGFPEDFQPFLDNLFFQSLNDYDPDRGSFSWYVSYILEKRFSPVVKKAIVDAQQNSFTIDPCEDETISILDNIEDPNQIDFCSGIAIDNFKYVISSPRRHLSVPERLQQKILLLQYAGYSVNEICRYLKITKHVLRYQLEKMKDNETIINLKLDLK